MQVDLSHSCNRNDVRIIDWVNVLCPNRDDMSHFGGTLLRQSVG